MALFETSFFSTTLGFGTDVYVYIPLPDSDDVRGAENSAFFNKGIRFPVLYLLHDVCGDASDWIRLTGVERYAHRYKLALVMPDAANSFYRDMVTGSAYLSYLLDELFTFVSFMFPVSTKREDTFIAGFSMGGYGAFSMALECPDRFAAAASLSGTLDLADLGELVKKEKPDMPFNRELLFEDPGDPEKTGGDLFVRAAALKKAGTVLPRFFQSIGTGDFLYAMNAAAEKRFRALGIDLTYEEHPGIHDRNYCDTHIKRVIEWLPLKGPGRI